MVLFCVGALMFNLAIFCQGRELAAMMEDDNFGFERTKRSDDVSPLEAVVTQLSQEMTSVKAQLEAAKAEMNEAKGSTFVRWGRSDCPASSHLVYPGVVGGSWYNSEGGSANRLCLSLQPEFDSVTHRSTDISKLYGAEYQFISDHHDYDVPCAVCEVALAKTLMVPGTKTCPAGWTVQYWGHLTGPKFDHHGAGEYICLDVGPEGRGAAANQDGALLYYTVTQCGSLPCPPYVDDRVVTCVVCSH